MATNVYGNGTTTASNGANTIVHFYDRAGIKAANAVSVYGQFADRKAMPQKMGKTFKISKWQHLYDLSQEDGTFGAKGYLGKRDLTTVSAALAATDGSGAGLAEGAGSINQVTPTKVTVETSLSRYGYMIEYTDEAVLFSEDPVQVKYREELGYLMNQTQEDLIQKDMLSSAGIVINAAGVADADMGSTITAAGANEDLYQVSFDLIRSGVKTLVRNRAQRNTEIVTGSTKIGTNPINKAFYGIVGPEVKYDLETLTRGATYEKEYAYIPAFKYAAASNLAEGEIGSMHDVRFIESEGALVETAAGALASAWRNDDALTDTDPRYATEAAAIAGGTAVSATLVTYDSNLSHTASGAEGATKFDLFPILFPTKGAFATVGLRGKNRMSFYAKSPEDVSLVNPHGTKGFFSSNFFYAGIALQPEKLARINVLATA